MKLYLDDDIASPRFAGMLRKAGHAVRLPADVGMVGEKDPVHLTNAVQQDRVCVTRDHSDFEILHNLVRAVGGHHPGILVVRQEQDRRRDMKARDIVRAIRNIEAANYDLADQCETLNRWC
jgi:predicted nuclease of predicted toxin-antitoxin system